LNKFFYDKGNKFDKFLNERNVFFGGLKSKVLIRIGLNYRETFGNERFCWAKRVRELKKTMKVLFGF
tara:strand:+ start:226 stop:426 length:201 start_codon:yes stop_codon:yes gene_type:complete